MKSVLFVYNPQAGKGTLRGKISDVLEVFRRKDMVVTVFPTVGAGDAYQLIKQHGAGFDRVICAGGDGTLHEAVHGLMEIPKEKRPGCGYIPTGTVNDFANGIKLPKRVISAAEVAAGDRCHAYDVGEMNGQYFSYVAAFGAFTSVSYETPQATKNLLGKTAYVLDGVTKLNTLRGIPVKVETEKESFEEECILGMVTNADSVGGLKIYRKTKIRLDDGVFDGVFVKKPRNPLELNLALGFLFTGNRNNQVRVIHGKKIHITVEKPTPFTLDGEAGGSHSEILISNHKQAIQFYHGLE